MPPSSLFFCIVQWGEKGQIDFLDKLAATRPGYLLRRYDVRRVMSKGKKFGGRGTSVTSLVQSAFGERSFDRS